MKKVFIFLASLLSITFLSLPVFGVGREPVDQYSKQVLTFSAQKEQQVRTLATELKIPLSPEITNFFKAATHGDGVTVTNTIARLAPEYVASYNNASTNAPVLVPFWQPMTEVESAYTALLEGGTKYPLAFGEGIIQSIPAGSIYFGGTDAGRGLVTALSESHVQAKPFYTLTQNALSDDRYMDYLRSMYGQRIYLPTTNEIQKAIDDYKSDALLRLKHDQNFPDEPLQLKRGEDVRLVDGDLQMHNAISVMAVHARLVLLILERNPKPEFYLEESYFMDLTYPYLEPHGLIFKLNHSPLPSLTSKMLETDSAYWTKQCQSMLGDSLKPDTSMSNLCVFVEASYGEKDLSHFTGDKAYLTNGYAQKAFSKLRVAIAGLYQWRLMNKPNSADKAQLQAATDYAFRQAFALCPTNPEVIYRYMDFLMMESRFEDAILMVRTVQKLDPESAQYHYDYLLQQLQRRQMEHTAIAP